MYLVIGSLLNVLIPTNGDSSLATIGSAINGQVNNLVGIAVASALAQFFTTFCNEITLTRVGNKVKNAYFRSLVKQEVGFFDMRKTGHFLNNITEDTLLVYLSLFLKYSSFGLYFCFYPLLCLIGSTSVWRKAASLYSVLCAVCFRSHHGLRFILEDGHCHVSCSPSHHCHLYVLREPHSFLH